MFTISPPQSSKALKLQQDDWGIDDEPEQMRKSVAGDDDISSSFTVASVIGNEYSTIPSATNQASQLLERIGKLEAEKDVLQHRVKQLTGALEATEREAAQKEEKLRSALAAARTQHRALEAEKAEMAKEISILQHRDNQYLHEIRKKERDLEKMQKKLQMTLNERGTKDTRSIELHGGPRASTLGRQQQQQVRTY